MNGLFKVKHKDYGDKHMVYAVRGNNKGSLEFLLYGLSDWYFVSANNYEPVEDEEDD